MTSGDGLSSSRVSGNPASAAGTGMEMAVRSGHGSKTATTSWAYAPAPRRWTASSNRPGWPPGTPPKPCCQAFVAISLTMSRPSSRRSGSRIFSVSPRMIRAALAQPSLSGSAHTGRPPVMISAELVMDVPSAEVDVIATRTNFASCTYVLHDSFTAIRRCVNHRLESVPVVDKEMRKKSYIS